MVNLKRIDKAVELVEKNRIEIILEDEMMIQFQVFSVNSNQRQHVVTYNGRTFHCTCEDYQKGRNHCYHCLGCSFFLRDLRREGQISFEDKRVREGFISPETPTGGVI